MPKVTGRAMKFRKFSLNFQRASIPTVQKMPTIRERMTRIIARRSRKLSATMHRVASSETATARGTSLRMALHMSA